MSARLPLTMLPYGGKTGDEIRTLYFYQAFGLPQDKIRIMSFGACNFRCPYCKRGTFEEDMGIDEHAVPTTSMEMRTLCMDAIDKQQVVRLSGGDPVMYQEESLALGEFVRSNGGRFSMAHNGSSPKFADRISAFLECAAIDIKGSPEEYPTVAGVGPQAYEAAFKTIEVLLRKGVIVDARTPIFGFTQFETLQEIARRLDHLRTLGKLFYTLRLFRDVSDCSFPEPDRDDVVRMAERIRKQVPHLPMGMRTKWDPNQAFVFF